MDRVEGERWMEEAAAINEKVEFSDKNLWFLSKYCQAALLPGPSITSVLVLVSTNTPGFICFFRIENP